MIRGPNYPDFIPKRLRSIKKDIKKRCYNKNSKRYKDYGGRGITICDEWLNNRIAFFLWSLKNGYADNLSIDRIDNDKGYSPDNCRWTNYDQQMQNSRKAKLTPRQVLNIRKIYPTLSYSQLAKKYKVNKTTIACIILRKTWRNI
jgi:hypothetical protein